MEKLQLVRGMALGDVEYKSHKWGPERDTPQASMICSALTAVLNSACCRSVEKLQLVRGMALGDVEYKSHKWGPERGTPLNPQADALNGLLQRLYARQTPAGPFDMIVVLEDHQACPLD